MRPTVTLFFAAAGVFLLAGCPPDETLVGGCRTDEECVAAHTEGWICSERFLPRVCECTADSACGRNEFCNSSGRCQPSVGCYRNADCPTEAICDLSQRRCIQETKCTSDIHCPIGSVCDLISYTCQVGCHRNADCKIDIDSATGQPIPQVCRCPGDSSCDLTTEVGLCKTGLCDDDTYCRYKELCVYDDVVGDNVCVEDTRGPYCDQCTVTAGATALCDQPGNYCLVDDSVPGGAGSFCGVDCGDGQPCPNGFACNLIVIAPTSKLGCSNNDQCPATGEACTTDDDCPGGRCDAGAGRCAGLCIGNEGGAAGTGYCTCVTDLDCPQDTCDATSRTCGLTSAPCQLDGDQCRGQLACVNYGGYGLCLIGNNCAPDEGITCAEVRSQ